jgi:hypothetical protein
MIIARRQIAKAREQTEATVRLERERVLSEAQAFHVMLEAAMARVLAEADRDLSADFFAVPRRVRRGPCRSPVHHQRRVRGIARRFRQAGRLFDPRVS